MSFYTHHSRLRGYETTPVRSSAGQTVYQPVAYASAPVQQAPGALPSGSAAPGSSISGTSLFSAQPGTPMESGARYRPAKARQAVRSSELLRFSASGPGVSALQDGSDALDGVVRALRAHLIAIIDERRWSRPNRAWAERLRDALGSMPVNAAGHYSPAAVRIALFTMPSAVRNLLDSSIRTPSIPTGRALGGYTTQQLLSDIAGGRFSAASTPGDSNPASGLLTASAASDLRNVAGRSAGGATATARAQDLVDRLGSYATGGSSGPAQDIMPTLTADQMADLRERATRDREAATAPPSAVPGSVAVGFLDSLPKPLVAAVAFGISFGLVRALRSR